MRLFILFCFVAFSNFMVAQNKAMTFNDAKLQGNAPEKLDTLYKGAIHTETIPGVFKTEAEQEQLIAAYTLLLQDLGAFLKKNNFIWEHPTRCFNRIYINKNGAIDYFLYNFYVNKEKPETNLSEAKIAEFDRLLNAFVKDYRFSLTANENFAQCSPVTYRN